jgi:hypothetical protein
MNRFIEQIKHSTEYDAGIVDVIDGNYAIAFETNGASKSFSVGMPIYDKDNNLMGYLGIGLYDGLNYGGTDVRVPCEYWQICLPTIYCKASKKVFTYWQMLERKEQE